MPFCTLRTFLASLPDGKWRRRLTSCLLPAVKRLPGPLGAEARLPLVAAAGGGALPGSTRMGGAMAPPTPFRDEMGINVEQGPGGGAMAGGNLRAEKRRRKVARSKVRQGLQNLPAAIHEYQLVMPEIPKELIESKQKQEREEDAEDLLAKLKKEQERKRDSELKLRPQAVQRSLPRPRVVNFNMKNNSTGSVAQNILTEELVTMLKHDLVAYPINAKEGKKKKRKIQPQEVHIEQFEAEELKRAKDLILGEAQRGPEDAAPMMVRILSTFLSSQASLLLTYRHTITSCFQQTTLFFLGRFTR